MADSLLFLLVLGTIAFLSLYALFSRLSRRSWRCDGCGRVFADEEAARGHQAMHATHRVQETD